MDNITFSDEEMRGIIDEVETVSIEEPEAIVGSGSSIETNQPEALPLEPDKPTEALALDCKIADMIRTYSRYIAELEKCENLAKFNATIARQKSGISTGGDTPVEYAAGEDPDPEDVPFCISYRGIPIVPVGGIMVLIGSQGVMKSYVSTGILASLESPGCDSFGFEVHLPDDRYAVVLDTELNRQILFRRYRTYCRRAGIEPRTHRRVRIRGIRGNSETNKLAILDKYLGDPQCGIVVLDCSTHFCEEFMDPTKSYSFVNMLMSAASTNSVTIIVTIHDNPVTSKNGIAGKARGHLGTMLPQQADAAFLISRDSTTGVGRITNKFDFAKNRHAGSIITQYFRWDDTRGYPVSIDEERYEQEFTSKQFAYVMNLFSGKESWTTKELKERIFEVEKISERTAVDRIKSYVDIGALVKIRTGVYSVSGTLLSENILGGSDE